MTLGGRPSRRRATVSLSGRATRRSERATRHSGRGTASTQAQASNCLTRTVTWR
jgi:hypothetical protein